jgi:hypothetical protein
MRRAGGGSMRRVESRGGDDVPTPYYPCYAQKHNYFGPTLVATQPNTLRYNSTASTLALIKQGYDYY